MQFQPPQKDYTSDVHVTVPNDVAAQGVDNNGIVVGRWKTSLFGCLDTLIPNALMSFLCPGVVVAQITARLGLAKFFPVLGSFCALYLLAIVAVVLHSGFLNVLMVLLAMSTAFILVRLRWKIRMLFSIPGTPLEDLAATFCCGCCSLAQMASHVESYQPSDCSFLPRGTLPGYV